MKKLAVALVLLGAWILGFSAWAQPYYNGGAVRGVYYQGELHYISDVQLDKEWGLGYWQRTPSSSNWGGPWEGTSQPITTTKLPSGVSLQNVPGQDVYGRNEYGQSLVIFGAMLINVAIAVDSDGNGYVVVTRLDLNTQKFLDSTKELELGHKNDGGYGVAAAVFNSTVYVFTRDWVATSSDGLNYTRSATALSDGLSDCEPLDAVAFYPPNAPAKVLVAFANCKTGEAAYFVWDGAASLPLDPSAIRSFHSTNSSYLCGATMLGTVKKYGEEDYCYFPSGSKNPCVQIFLWSRYEGALDIVESWEYDATADALTARGSCQQQFPLMQFHVYPWFVTTTDNDTGFYVQEQLLVLNLWACEGSVDCGGGAPFDFPLSSDYMEPQNQDPSPNGYGWQGTPTNTMCPANCSDDELAQWQTYWSLSGVILGPPPFALNGISPDDQNHIMALSNVAYGKDMTDSIQHGSSWSNTYMLSSGTQVTAGLGLDKTTLFSLDLSYKHGSTEKESTTTSYTADINCTFGTQNESYTTLGTHGYAIFTAPVLVTQVLKLYAYDYEFEKNPQPGTYLGQELTTVAEGGTTPDGAPPSINVMTTYFSLETPGGETDQVRGLMKMQVDPTTGAPYSFPVSTDLKAWNGMVWEKAGAPWKVLYGTQAYGGYRVPPLSMGGATTITFTQKEDSTSSQGYTNATSISIGGPITRFLLEGLDSTLTAGYSSETCTETTVTSEVNQNIQLSLRMMIPDCTQSDSYSNWQVQPYLLQATDYSAPWVPQGYALNLPWCITWFAKGTSCSESQAGVSPQPDELAGSIAGGGSGESSYSVKGGHLTWVEDDGGVTPIPMTADTFDPGLGATLELNEHLLSATPSTGKWTRKGQVWKFKSKGSSGKNRITLALDFGAQAWSFDGERLSLSGAFRPCDPHVMARLTVNGFYTFRFDAEQEVKSEWKLVLPGTDERKLEVTKFEGRCGWSDRKDKATLEGRLPSNLGWFGNISFVLNGHQRDVRLLSLKGFGDALARGKVLTYEAGGAKVVVDFGKKKWSAQFEGEGFHRLMAPRWGGVRLAVKVGGKTLYATEHALADFRTELKFKS